MGRSKDISSPTRKVIMQLFKAGQHSNRKIAKLVKVSASTVDREARNVSRTSASRQSKRINCRRERLTTPRDDRKIVNTAVLHRRASARAITKILEDSGIKLSTVTVRRRLREAGLKCRRPAKKPRLTPRMKKRRLIWGRMHQHLTVDDWNKVQ